MRLKDINKKSVRIHDEDVNDWVERMPYGYFTILVNELLNKEYERTLTDTKVKERNKLKWIAIPKERSEFNNDDLF